MLCHRRCYVISLLPAVNPFFMLRNHEPLQTELQVLNVVRDLL
jgi:hypothetical protein